MKHVLAASEELYHNESLEKGYRKSRRKSHIAWGIAIFLSVFYLIVSITPYIFMVLNSFKGQFEMLLKGIFVLPESLDFNNYVNVINNGIYRYFLNSLFIVGVSLALLLLIAAFASYPIARLKFKFNNVMFTIIVACMAIPIHITLIPIFKMTKDIGFYDTLFALIGPFVAINIPISVFLLSGFMKEIPREIEESAEIDGCNKIRTFFAIIFPLTKPGMATIAIYNGVMMWNEFVFSYTLTQSPEVRTLPLAVWDYKGLYSMNTPMIMAVLTISSVPMILMFIFLQEKMIKGLTAGAVKG